MRAKSCVRMLLNLVQKIDDTQGIVWCSVRLKGL